MPTVASRVALPVLASLSAAGLAWGSASCSSGDSCGTTAPGDVQEGRALSQDSILLQSKYNVDAKWGLKFGFGGRRRDSEAPTDAALTDDWTMELTLDNAWIAGGGIDDVDFANLTAEGRAAFIAAAHEKADAIAAEGGEWALQMRESWRQTFANLHSKVVQRLKQRHLDGATSTGQPCKRHPGAGAMSGLYTFGAPATALAPLKDPLAADGKFPGLRCVTQRRDAVYKGISRTYSDPVTWLAGIPGLKHPHMDMLALPIGFAPELHNASAAVSLLPRSDMAMWVRGHFQNMYTDAIDPVKAQYSPKLYEMLYLARAVDPNTVKPINPETTAREAQHVGWNVVAQSQNIKLSWIDVSHRDNVTLFQDPNTQACALSFVPTHKVNHWSVNMRFLPRSFCGLPNVHKGFRDNVRRTIRSPGWAARVQPAMQSCREMYVTGHSLGAGQAQLVAACLQRAPAEGEDGWDDYKHLVWTPSPDASKTLPAIGLA